MVHLVVEVVGASSQNLGIVSPYTNDVPALLLNNRNCKLVFVVVADRLYEVITLFSAFGLSCILCVGHLMDVESSVNGQVYLGSGESRMFEVLGAQSGLSEPEYISDFLLKSASKEQPDPTLGNELLSGDSTNQFLAFDEVVLQEH